MPQEFPNTILIKEIWWLEGTTTQKLTDQKEIIKSNQTRNF